MSKWYRQVKLKPHAHQWAYLWSAHQDWGGEVVCGDSFGFDLIPLELLKEASEEVDRATFEDLAQDYYAMRQEPAKTEKFCRRCREIVSDEELPTPDATEPVMK